MVHNIDLYQVFYFTAKTGSLSKAAEELYITQPAVTHAIKQLEGKLGGALFFRTSKGVTLTTEGEMLYSHIEPAYQLIANGERKLREMHELESGEVRIGAGDTLCKHVLLPHLQSFHQTYPNIKLHVFNRTTADTISLLKEGKIDIGVVNLPVSDPRIEIAQGAAIHDIFVAGERFRQAADAPLSYEQLTAYPLMMLEQGSSTRSYIDKSAASSGCKLTPEIELGSLDLLVDFARSGFGLACVVKEFIAEELEERSLYEVRLERPIPPRHIGIIKLKSSPLSAATMQLYRMLVSGK
jgi:DNA-binding transcriptional LysR family regulator